MVGSALRQSADDLRVQWQESHRQKLHQGPSGAAKSKLINTPELKEQRNAWWLYLFRRFLTHQKSVPEKTT